MKKVLALALALVLVLSLVACGSSKSVITVSDLSKKLETAHSNLNLTKSGDTYSWSGKVIMDSDTAEIKVKADDKDQVVSVSITDKGIYNDVLSSWSSITELMKKDSKKYTVGEVTASVCILQSTALIEAAANDDSAISSSEKLEELFTNGSCEVKGWKISINIDKTANEINIKMV